MKVLLHTCCADCCLKLIESIKRELKVRESDITIFYFNPNIHPRAEFLTRMDAVKKALADTKVKMRIGDWTPKVFFKELKACKADVGDEKSRCPVCWKVRLSETFKVAAEKEFDLVSTTLFSSKYQDFDVIEKIVSALSQKYGVDYFVPKHIECEMKTRGFYKQNYTGCVYSLKERLEEKWLT